MTFLSVVIPTYHRNELLARCLDCLAPGRQTLAAQKYEVIVTDAGEQTTAESMIQQYYPWVQWVASGGASPAANRNHGAQYARGDWLVFTDDDCLPQANWLQTYVQTINMSSSLALEGAIHPLGNPHQDLAECPTNLSGGNFWSANIAIQRQLFAQIGGFDANYPLAAFEDQDLKISLEARTKITFVPGAIVQHPVRIMNLLEAIKRIPRRCFAYAHHIRKNRQALGYQNDWLLSVFQYKFHFATLVTQLKNRTFRSACTSFVMLTIGIPTILIATNLNFANLKK